MVRGLLGRGCFVPQGVGRVFAADDPLCSSCHCNHGPAALPASLDPERIKWSARTDWGAGDPPGSLSEDGVMCDACVYRALSVLRVPLVVLCSACLVGLCADACVSAESLGFLAPGVEERVTVPRLDRRPCAGRWQGAPLLFLSATVPLLVRLDACVLCAASLVSCALLVLVSCALLLSGCPDPLRRGPCLV